MQTHDFLESRLFPDDVVARFASLDPREDGACDLPGEEARAVAGAHPRRRAEFALGRRLARDALERLGTPVAALGRDDDRLPRWPAGVVGCISHTRRAAGDGVREAPGGADGEGLLGVAVARASAYQGIGLDIEPHRPTAEGIAAKVCFGEELAWIAGGADGPAGVGRRCRTIFSIKEAVYKAFYPSLREVWGFDRVAVRVDPEAERFTAALPRSTGRREVSGHVRIRSGWIVSTVVVPAEGR